MQLLLLLWFFSQDAYYLQPVRFKTTLNFFFYFVKLIMRNYDPEFANQRANWVLFAFDWPDVVKTALTQPTSG